MNGPFIPVAKPSLAGNEKLYVMDCLETTWISSAGKYVGQFEHAFATFCDAPFASSCVNGTAALHLALLALDIGPGDEIIVPTLSYIATANAIRYCGATPVFVDSDPLTWNIDPAEIASKITARTRAVMVVHLYGYPCDMDPILSVARQANIFVIEDAAEAHGALYKGRPVGCLGDISAFSFFGNKVMTTGEGGMVVTRDEDLHRKVGLLKNQGVGERRYWHSVVGFNYRMTNIAAAIGLAQLEQVQAFLAARSEVLSWYHEELSDVEGVEWQVETEGFTPSHWMFTVTLPVEGSCRDRVIDLMRQRNVETRPLFYPTHLLPPYSEHSLEQHPVAERIGSHGISLPTWVGLTREDVARICANLREVLVVVREGTKVPVDSSIH